MAPVLYKHDNSPPARAVMMVADILQLKLDQKDINPVLREQDTEEHTKMNPMRTVPFLDDNGFYLADSHAIIPYLIEKYGRPEHLSLYPRDIQTRATIHQRLLFDCGILFPRLRAVMAPTFFRNLTELTKNMKINIDDAYRTLESYLIDNQYLVGSTMTVADVSVLSTISSIDGLHPIDEKRFPNTKRWFTEMSSKEFAKRINEPGNVGMITTLKTFMENNKTKSKL